MTNGVEGWSGEQPTEGDVVVGPLTESGSLMMECKGPIGSEIQTVAITVVDATTDAADSPTSSTKKVGGGVVDLFLLSGLLLLMAGARRTNRE